MLHWFAKRLREVQEVPRNERGFTLIELLVVVIIIGILAAIAIPVFLGQRDRARDANAQSNVRTALSAAKTFYTDSESYTGMTADDLEGIEPTLTYANAPVANNPQQIGFTVDAVNQVTLGSCSLSGTCFWIRSNENTGTTYGTSTAPNAAPTNWQANDWP